MTFPSYKEFLKFYENENFDTYEFWCGWSNGRIDNYSDTTYDNMVNDERDYVDDCSDIELYEEVLNHQIREWNDTIKNKLSNKAIMKMANKKERQEYKRLLKLKKDLEQYKVEEKI